MGIWAAILAAAAAFVVAAFQVTDCVAVRICWAAAVILSLIAVFLFCKEQDDTWNEEQDEFRADLLSFAKSMSSLPYDPLSLSLKWACIDLNKPPQNWITDLRRGDGNKKLSVDQELLLGLMEGAYKKREGTAQGRSIEGTPGSASLLGDQFWEFHASRQRLAIRARRWGDRLRQSWLQQPFGRFRRWVRREVVQYERPLIVLQYAEIALAAAFFPAKGRGPGDQGQWALFKRLQGMR